MDSRNVFHPKYHENCQSAQILTRVRLSTATNEQVAARNLHRSFRLNNFFERTRGSCRRPITAPHADRVKVHLDINSGNTAGTNADIVTDAH